MSHRSPRYGLSALVRPAQSCWMALLTHYEALRDAQIGSPWHVSHPMKGTSRASRRARQERVSRPQEGRHARKKCDAYCHNFMRPRRSTRPTIVTETCSFFRSPSFLCSHILKYYSYFFKFRRILFYVMHNYAENHSKTHKKCINMHIIV